jgi:hypothetical protein
MQGGRDRTQPDEGQKGHGSGEGSREAHATKSNAAAAPAQVVS